MRRFLYFLLGVAFTCTTYSVFVLWNAYHEFQVEQLKLKIENLLPSQKKLELSSKDLVGTWHGEESWGNRYTIIRQGDGTFSEVYDTSHGDVPWRPPVVKSKGCWSFTGLQYAYYYTQSTELSLVGHGPWIRSITPTNHTEFTYSEDEGNGVREHKE